MKGYLLDTHTLIWMQEDQSLLSPIAVAVIANEHNRIFVSIASFWEVAIKRSLGKLQLKYDLGELATACASNRIEILHINLYHLYQLQQLPFIHRDPFDRLLIATAYTDGLGFVSKDKQLEAYNIKLIWLDTYGCRSVP